MQGPRTVERIGHPQLPTGVAAVNTADQIHSCVFMSDPLANDSDPSLCSPVSWRRAAIMGHEVPAFAGVVTWGEMSVKYKFT